MRAIQAITGPLEIVERFPNEIPIKDCFESYLELIRFRNPALYLHSQRVGIVAYLLALAMGYPSKFADLLQYAGWVHDLGALFPPSNMHPHFLREELYHIPEWQKIYKLHPVVGAKIWGKSLKDALFDLLQGSKRLFDPKAISELTDIEETIKVWLNLIEEESEPKLKENMLVVEDGLNEALKANTYN